MIVLVITIIVMIILAAAIILVLNSNGIIGKAGDAQTKWNEAHQKELNQMDDIDVMMGNSTRETINKNADDMTTNGISYIGYFADVDDDGEVDGVIYADLLVGKNSEDYTIPKITDASTVKDYFISQESYTVPNASGYASKPVLKATGDGVDRFYIMALEDFTKETLVSFSWYFDATDGDEFEAADDLVFEGFGKGYDNTEIMIEKWSNLDFGYQYDTDIFKYMEEKISLKWFLPSRYEWSAFIESLESTITKDSEFATAYGLTNSYYWTSSKTEEYVYFR